MGASGNDNKLLIEALEKIRQAILDTQQKINYDLPKSIEHSIANAIREANLGDIISKAISKELDHLPTKIHSSLIDALDNYFRPRDRSHMEN